MSRIQMAVTAMATLWLAACGASTKSGDGSATRPGACAPGEVLVSGHVERDRDSAHQYQGEVSLGSDSLAVVRLFSGRALGGDGTSTLVAEQRLAPAPALPFEYCITGVLPSDPAIDLEYHVSAAIAQHGDLGASTVGDLRNESLDIVEPPATDFTIRVIAMEACSAPDAGGFCIGP
ncbi:MAG TPA: hypothetical protein VHP33_37600 [Polyangiaceae bacterium]|nr:hypothetical protein [Polyangiaceae bacterium]